MGKAQFTDLVRRCDQSIAELPAVRRTAQNLPLWTRLSRARFFPFLRHQVEIAELALSAGGGAHYQRIHLLCEEPYAAAARRWRITEMIAAVAECRVWALDRLARARRKRGPAGGKSASGKRPAAGRAVRRRTIPVEPGRRLRGGREILVAMEGLYTYARWRAFKREALKHGAPIEWGPRGTPARAYENVLRLWLADRVEAAERARVERETRARRKAEFDTTTGRYAYHAGGGHPLGIVKRPGGRQGR